MIDEATLTEQEKRMIAEFREQVTGVVDGVEPPLGEEPQVKSISVINESLGQTPRGEKIQYKPGIDPETGQQKPYSPAKRGADRLMSRLARADEAREEAKKRRVKGRNSVVKEVRAFADKLEKMNVQEATAFILQLSDHDRERAALAEQVTQNRSTITRNAGFQVSRKVREQYDAELALIEELTAE